MKYQVNNCDIALFYSSHRSYGAICQHTLQTFIAYDVQWQWNLLFGTSSVQPLVPQSHSA